MQFGKIFYFLQGEAGKPGERGVMGAIGAPVSVNIYSVQHNNIFNKIIVISIFWVVFFTLSSYTYIYLGCCR